MLNMLNCPSLLRTRCNLFFLETLFLLPLPQKPYHLLTGFRLLHLCLSASPHRSFDISHQPYSTRSPPPSLNHWTQTTKAIWATIRCFSRSAQQRSTLYLRWNTHNCLSTPTRTLWSHKSLLGSCRICAIHSPPGLSFPYTSPHYNRGSPARVCWIASVCPHRLPVRWYSRIWTYCPPILIAGAYWCSIKLRWLSSLCKAAVELTKRQLLAGHSRSNKSGSAPEQPSGFLR